MAAKFEIAKQYEDQDIQLPIAKTDGSAGYDFFVAEDTIVPSWINLYNTMLNYPQPLANPSVNMTLSEMAEMTKATGAKPTLVSTGVKCKLDPGTYLELSLRSSTPLKYWLLMANSIGVIDADYYGNSSNDGLIYIQLINFSPFDIQLKKGDCIAQGIIHKYYVSENGNSDNVRTGGFGSTDD